jgi:hypothetical protein
MRSSRGWGKADAKLFESDYRSSVRDKFKLIFVAATVYVSHGAESDRPSAVP